MFSRIQPNPATLAAVRHEEDVSAQSPQTRQPSQAAPAAANFWTKARQLLQGTIPLVQANRSEVRNYVASDAPKPMPYLNVRQRERFRFDLKHGMIAGQQLLAVTDRSGHYQPEIETTYRFLKFLERKFASLENVAIKLHTLPHHINAQAFLDGVMPAVKQGMSLKEAVEHAARSAEPVDPSGHYFQTTRITVQAPDHQLYAGLDRQELATHSVVTSGGPVRWAGELVTANPDQPNLTPDDLDMLKAYGLL